MTLTHTKKGMSMVELMVVVAIVVIVVSAGVGLIGPTINRNALLNQMRYTRASFLKAKATALEYTSAVRMSVDATDGSILIVRDNDRDGDFSDDPTVVVGQSSTQGQPSPYKDKIVPDADAGGQDLPIWFQAGDFAGDNALKFPDGGLIIMPTGRVYDYALNPTGGTFFFKAADGSHFGAVHITAMGEVRLAMMLNGAQGEGDLNGWNWLEK